MANYTWGYGLESMPSCVEDYEKMKWQRVKVSTFNMQFLEMSV